MVLQEQTANMQNYDVLSGEHFICWKNKCGVNVEIASICELNGIVSDCHASDLHNLVNALELILLN